MKPHISNHLMHVQAILKARLCQIKFKILHQLPTSSTPLIILLTIISKTFIITKNSKDTIDGRSFNLCTK